MKLLQEVHNLNNIRRYVNNLSEQQMRELLNILDDIKRHPEKYKKKNHA